MKLVSFTYTNEYDNQVEIQINPNFVVTVRPDGKTHTSISLASKAQITVDGSIDQVVKALSPDYDQPETQPEQSIVAVDQMPENG